MFRTLTFACALMISNSAFAQSEPQGDYAEVNGMSMYYEVSGSGDPLIVLHGAYINIPAMGDIIGKLAQTHKVYALELQGHGRTEDIDRPITYPNLADDVAEFMDIVGLGRADVFGYSMGAGAGLQFAIRHPEKIDQLVAASVSCDLEGMQPEFHAMVPSMAPEMFVGTPMEDAWKEYAPNPDGFSAFVERLIALEHEPQAWADDVKGLKAPVLIIAGDADMMTLEHLVTMFRLLGGGMAGDMGNPLSASRLACLLYLAQMTKTMMPTDPNQAAETLEWTIAALNSIEIVSLAWVEIGGADDPENKLSSWLDMRLGQLNTVLETREWFAAGRFTVADMMADVLRQTPKTATAKFTAITAYVDRLTKRKAFAKAYQDQLALFAIGDEARASASS